MNWHTTKGLGEKTQLLMGCIRNTKNYMYNFYRISDGKAYLLIGTIIGATGAKSQLELQLCVAEKTWKLRVNQGLSQLKTRALYLQVQK